MYRFCTLFVGQSIDVYLISHHKCGIETKTEMTDDLVFVGLIFVLFQKLCSTGESDLCDVLFHLIRCHTETIIDKLHGLGLRIHNDLDLCLIIIRQLILAHHVQLFQLGDGIASVGDQLTHENIVIGIQPFFNDRKNIIAVDRQIAMFLCHSKSHSFFVLQDRSFFRPLL